MHESNFYLQQAMREQGISYAELAKRTGIPKSTLQRYAVGATKKIPLDAVAKIEKALQTSTPEWDTYYKYSNILPIEKQKYPLIGEIACGQPILAEEHFEGYIEAGGNIKADFCLKAQGDSMINARIFDGDIVFIKQQPEVENGAIAAVVIDEEATLKRVYKTSDTITLTAENPAYPPLVYTKKDGVTVKILGKAVAFQSIVK